MVDKNSIIQVFGSLMKDPQLLSQVDKYRLVPEDFSVGFERIIFGAIVNLYRNGAQKISVVDIDNYLSLNPELKAIFDRNNGIEYLQDAEDLSSVDTFQYYYERLKKFNLLNDLKKMGYNTNNIYSENILDKDNKEINERFEELRIPDIISIIKGNIAKIETNYSTGSESEAKPADHQIDELIEQLKDKPEVGAMLQGDFFNGAVRGARKGKFYIRSAASGTGKTRHAVGDGCILAYPIRFNSRKQKWENMGACEKVLFIATEQEVDEIQTMILAYLSDVNEEDIIQGRFSGEKEKRLKQASYVMKKYSDNFQIVRLSNPNIEQLRAIIRQYSLVNGVKNVFFDYIFSSPSLLNEFRDLKIREDVVLTMMSTALKDLAVEQNIFIMSATQTNSTEEESKGIKNHKSVRGSKGIIDKSDVAVILSKVTYDELEMLKKIIEECGIEPNQVTDLYKNRRGRYVDIRIWSRVDLGTCRKQDLFVTDSRYQMIHGFTPIGFMFEGKGLKDTSDILNFLNEGEITNEEVLVEEIKEEIKEEEIKEEEIEEKIEEEKESLFGEFL